MGFTRFGDECLAERGSHHSAGDIGNRSLLQQLEAIAPVIAVRGNVDNSSSICLWQRWCPSTVAFLCCMPEPAISIRPPPDCDVVSGHSHQPGLIGGVAFCTLT
jgi:hypothetical protein